MSAEDITEEPCIDHDHENDDVQVSTLCVLQTFEEDDILSDAFLNFSLLELCASDGR